MSEFKIDNNFSFDYPAVKDLIRRIKSGLKYVQYDDIKLIGLDDDKEREFINYIVDNYGVLISYDKNDYYSDDAVVQYINFIKDIPLLSDEDFKKYFYEYKHGSKEALDMLIVSNLRLVPYVARNCYDGRLPFADLISAGNLGLYDAFRKYDPMKGRFSTYAYEWISQKMKRATAAESRNVRFAYGAYYKFVKYAAFLIEYYASYGCYPPDDVIMEKIDITYDTLQRFKMFYQDTLSFNTPVVDAEESYLEDFLCDKDEFSIPEIVYKKELSSSFEKILNGYSSQKQKIIRMRFGFDDGERKTLREISEEVGITKEGVRSSQNRVLAKLRNSLEVRQLHPDYDNRDTACEKLEMEKKKKQVKDDIISEVYSLEDVTAEEICIIKALFSSDKVMSITKAMELDILNQFDDDVKIKLINSAIDKYLTLYKKGVKKYVRK